VKTAFYSLLLSAALAGPATAQTDLAGTWQGRLELAPGQTLAIHFVIAAAPDGGYSAVVTSPDSGAIKNVRATSVTFADSKLTVDVPALSGGYTGTLRGSVLEGQWLQGGAKLPLSLRPYETPTLTQADIDTLRGEWFGKVRALGVEAVMVLRFGAGADGAFRALLDSPEQGVRDLAASSVALDDGYFSVQVPFAGSQIEITGKLEGDQIVGQYNQLGLPNPVPLTLKKGRYVPVTSYLDLAAAAREQLAGRWSGTFGPISMIVRFETDAEGRALGFVEIPQMMMKDAAITEAALAGTMLSFGIAAVGAQYTGELAGDTATGEWRMAGFPNPVPLALKRE
jgi:hypothetical protein